MYQYYFRDKLDYQLIYAQHLSQSLLHCGWTMAIHYDGDAIISNQEMDKVWELQRERKLWGGCMWHPWAQECSGQVDETGILSK